MLKSSHSPGVKIVELSAIRGFGPDDAVTMAQVNEIVNTAINGAVSNLRKKDLPAIINEAVAPLNDSLKTLTDSMSGFTEKFKDFTPPAAGSGGNGGGGGEPKVSPEINAKLKKNQEDIDAMTRTLNQLKAEKEASDKRAEAAERNTVIRSAMTESLGDKKQFITPSAVETAFVLLEPHVKKTDEGKWIAGDNLPIKDFATSFFTDQHPYLLKGVSAGGAGASNGSSAGGSHQKQKEFDISAIKPGMSAEDRATALAHISSAIGGGAS